MCRGLKLGSKSNWDGSILMGDWRRPLLHMAQSGFIKPQNAGPVNPRRRRRSKKKQKKKDKESFISRHFTDIATRWAYRSLPPARDLFCVTQLICTYRGGVVSSVACAPIVLGARWFAAQHAVRYSVLLCCYIQRKESSDKDQKRVYSWDR